VSRSSPSSAVAPCYQRTGEQMVGSGLALPRRLAAKRWRQAGAKETRSVSARGGGCSLTHTFADHFLHSAEEKTRTRRRWRGLGQQLEPSHQQPQRPLSKQGFKHPTSKLLPSFTQGSAQTLAPKLHSLAEKELTRSSHATQPSASVSTRP